MAANENALTQPKFELGITVIIHNVFWGDQTTKHIFRWARPPLYLTLSVCSFVCQFVCSLVRLCQPNLGSMLFSQISKKELFQGSEFQIAHPNRSNQMKNGRNKFWGPPPKKIWGADKFFFVRNEKNQSLSELPEMARILVEHIIPILSPSQAKS